MRKRPPEMATTCGTGRPIPAARSVRGVSDDVSIRGQWPGATGRHHERRLLTSPRLRQADRHGLSGPDAFAPATRSSVAQPPDENADAAASRSGGAAAGPRRCEATQRTATNPAPPTAVLPRRLSCDGWCATAATSGGQCRESLPRGAAVCDPSRKLRRARQRVSGDHFEPAAGLPCRGGGWACEGRRTARDRVAAVSADGSQHEGNR